MVRYMIKEMGEHTPVLKVVMEDNQYFILHIDDVCEIVTHSGRVFKGTIAYVGAEHIDVRTENGKVMVLFSSIREIIECKH